MGDKRFKLIGIILLAIAVPSAGHVFLGKGLRGLMLLFWMIALGFITYKLTGPEISVWGRYAGGFAVWALSVLDAAHLARLRFA